MSDKKQKSLIALRKAKTSLEKMIQKAEKDITSCDEIIIQNLAVIGLIKSANISLIEAFFEKCQNDEIKKEKILHILTLLQK